jgi:two-component system, NarL family, nitrate/nitrite response regulator NarL
MEDALATLTRRERQVLRLLALGYTNREIAGVLDVSVRTAEVHRASVQRKLGVKARFELVRFALRHGVLDTSSVG